MSDTTQVAVIGGGPGGYVAAFRAADLGLDVTLVNDDANPGGVCLYRGCIPSKALLHVASVIAEAKDAAKWGVSFGEPTIDRAAVNAWKQGVVDKMTGGLGELSRRRSIEYVRGKARFVSASELDVALEGGGRRTLQFEHAIVATGSRPVVIPSLDIGSDRVMDSTGALDVSDPIESLLVVGGGYIGLELGTAHAALGTKVSVVEMTSGLLPGADPDLVRPLQKRLGGVLDAIMLGTTVKDIAEVTDGLSVIFESADGQVSEQTYDKVLVSVGRKPNAEDIGLENTAVQVGQGGFVEVDGQRRTGEANIFAIGDVAGQPMLAHKASHEGIVAAETIAGHRVAFEPYAIPAVVFTDPEIAWCGLTESEAKKRGVDVAVARFPWGASGRATTLDRNDGLTKLLIDPETERVLGVGIVGVGAGDMIAEGAHAMEMAATASDLALTIHPHPTLSETIMEAADVFFGTSPHLYAPKK